MKSVFCGAERSLHELGAPLFLRREVRVFPMNFRRDKPKKPWPFISMLISLARST